MGYTARTAATVVILDRDAKASEDEMVDWLLQQVGGIKEAFEARFPGATINVV